MQAHTHAQHDGMTGGTSVLADGGHLDILSLLLVTWHVQVPKPLPTRSLERLKHTSPPPWHEPPTLLQPAKSPGLPE